MCCKIFRAIGLNSITITHSRGLNKFKLALQRIEWQNRTLFWQLNFKILIIRVSHKNHEFFFQSVRTNVWVYWVKYCIKILRVYKFSGHIFWRICAELVNEVHVQDTILAFTYLKSFHSVHPLNLWGGVGVFEWFCKIDKKKRGGWKN